MADAQPCATPCTTVLYDMWCAVVKLTGAVLLKFKNPGGLRTQCLAQRLRCRAGYNSCLRLYMADAA